MRRMTTLFGLTDELSETGRHSGFLKVPYSSNDSAYGIIPVPLTVIGGRRGPTVLLLAGVFGDEPDSQMAVARILQALDPASMSGRVIAITMANFPAARVGTRTSPLDGRTLSRSFPGNALGTPTSIIADYIERHLMPLSDIVLDLHSDGRSTHYLPSATLIYHADPETRLRRLAVAQAFGAPNMLVFLTSELRGTSGAAHRAGSVRIGTEMGGPRPVEHTAAGIRRVLDWAGITGASGPAQPSPSTWTIPGDRGFIYADIDGSFEPACEVGDMIEAGAVAGYLHDLMRPLHPPLDVIVPIGGRVVCSRGSGPAMTGDCLMHVGQEPDADLAADCLSASRLTWLGPKTRSSRKRPARSD